MVAVQCSCLLSTWRQAQRKQRLNSWKTQYMLQLFFESRGFKNNLNGQLYVGWPNQSGHTILEEFLLPPCRPFLNCVLVAFVRRVAPLFKATDKQRLPWCYCCQFYSLPWEWLWACSTWSKLQGDEMRRRKNWTIPSLQIHFFGRQCIDNARKFIWPGVQTRAKSTILVRMLAFLHWHVDRAKRSESCRPKLPLLCVLGGDYCSIRCHRAGSL